MRSLFLTTLHTVVVAGVVGIPCTQDQHTRMQEQFSDCRSNFTHQIHNDGKKGKGELLCTVLDGIVNICSKNWKQCHSQQEINSMKDMHTDAFLKHWGEDSSLDLCSIVKRFRLSQRIAESEEAVASCSDEDSRSSMSNFQSCSHRISSTVYSSILELEEEKGVVSELCSGLDKIALECPVHLIID
ncbi:uncharacterized protein LOC111713723 [Eurytemora carolleeae]|uniref:uncharacterized protein LOC111713723 n=1 Tax=Eurytemora carolleeae TaxID=1294199 RepID=UPI000C76B611|nr:uncharacterized protein LOC111713723 [Eurytemora carolleeae]|eukprot:XP_023344432.1 uncharacterized protein LOC111713723 [Eurytemora affinis]